MKIVICSDNHTNRTSLEYILRRHPDADYYWHIGDSEFFDEKELRPFISVKGNNDYGLNLPLRREIELKGHRFLLTHGTGIFGGDLVPLALQARERGADTVIFGHTHQPYDDVVEGIRMVNPGSCWHNRGGFKKPTYCVMNINDEGIIDVYFYEIDNR